MDKIPAMKGFWLLSVVLALGWGVQAQATDWIMDKQTSKLQFVVRYEGSPAVGVFRQFDTRLDFDPRPITFGMFLAVPASCAAGSKIYY